MPPDRQRRERRSRPNPGPEPTEPHRENVPGELDHASSGVDEFEAAVTMTRLDPQASARA